MSSFTTGVSGLLMILVLLGSLTMSGTFLWFGIRHPTRQGKVTCVVLSIMSLLPVAFALMLAFAVQD